MLERSANIFLFFPSFFFSAKRVKNRWKLKWDEPSSTKRAPAAPAANRNIVSNARCSMFWLARPDGEDRKTRPAEVKKRQAIGPRLAAALQIRPFATEDFALLLFFFSVERTRLFETVQVAPGCVVKKSGEGAPASRWISGLQHCLPCNASKDGPHPNSCEGSPTLHGPSSYPSRTFLKARAEIYITSTIL